MPCRRATYDTDMLGRMVSSMSQTFPATDSAGAAAPT
jgi:hypothetical protein